VSTTHLKPRKVTKHTEVEENSSGNGALNCKGSVGLKSADLLLRLLRGGDCDRLVW
jgi:hypothetical protein